MKAASSMPGDAGELAPDVLVIRLSDNRPHGVHLVSLKRPGDSMLVLRLTASVGLLDRLPVQTRLCPPRSKQLGSVAVQKGSET